MGSLGLSLCRPDFIITYFYKVFGFDPSRFGSVVFKKSVMGTLYNQVGLAGSSMVKILSIFPNIWATQWQPRQ